jgi:hypothetical protein
LTQKLNELDINFQLRIWKWLNLKALMISY